MSPDLPDDGYKVALIGEALGEEEKKIGSPFRGRAGWTLTRLLQWAGLNRDMFDVWNTVWCQPPQNALDGQWYEKGSIAECRERYWHSLPERVNVIVPMGNVPFSAFSGRKGILKARGYIWPGPDGTHMIPTVHPSFIQRGQAKYSAPFIHDVQKAVMLAQNGLPISVTDYTLDPSPEGAYRWAQEFLSELQRNPKVRLAYDIETPKKGEDEGELNDDDDPSYFIWRIGFSYKAHHALSIPWEPSYIPTIRLLLESFGEKVVWNAGFDNPRIRANGVEINGIVHDGMIAWHILHSDLPKGLGFVVPFTCPWEPAWKHTAKAEPALYNAKDADYEWRSFDVIETELKQTGLWGVYENDVVEMEPILIHMHTTGMPIDPDVRLDRATKLAKRQEDVMEEVEKIIPASLRKVTPPNGYIRDPADTNGLVRITVRAPVRRCANCGLLSPKKPHFKIYKKKENPCGGADVIEREEEVERWAKQEELKLSSSLLLKYQEAMDRPVPTKWDKKERKRKPTMDVKALDGLVRRYPDDPIYTLTKQYRALDKIAGTYIGRVE